MSRPISLAIAAGGLSSLFYLAVGLGSFGSLILAYLAQLPLFAIGLHAGFRAALIAAGVGLALVAATLPINAALLFILTTALPVLVLVNRAMLNRTGPDGGLEWYPPGHLLAALSGLALVALVVATALLWDRDGGIIGAGRAQLAEMMEGVSTDAATQEAVRSAQDRLAKFLPALVLTSWQIMVIVNGLLAQGVLSRFALNIRPGAPFAELWLPPWLSIVLAVSVAGSFLPGQFGALGENAAIVAALPFVFLGLSVIHAISIRWPARTFVLVCVYFGLFVVGWPALIIAAIGVLEPWFHLRLRFSGRRDEDEET